MSIRKKIQDKIEEFLIASGIHAQQQVTSAWIHGIETGVRWREGVKNNMTHEVLAQHEDEDVEEKKEEPKEEEKKKEEVEAKE